VTRLDPTAGHLVMINTFTVEPCRAEELLAVLSHATEVSIRHRRGFVSANLHVSHDKRHVANYAQWRSREDLDAMMKDPAAHVHMRDAASIATSFTPIYYELRETHSVENSK
jgi:quinol monooxygenase YgiN